MSNQSATTTAVGFVQKDLQAVIQRVTEMRQQGILKMPADYSYENAMHSAWLTLQETTDKDKRPVLTTCSKISIQNSLLKMVTLGLSTMKKQCNFIARGNKLYCEPEYAGNIALAKRYGGLKKIKANPIFKDDIFEFHIDGVTGRKTVIKHEQKLESLGSKELRGAYAIFELEDGSVDTEIMSIMQIRDAWNQGDMKGNSPAHKNFPDQMACKTVINRACKLIIRSSNDEAVMSEFDEASDPVYDTVSEEIRKNANAEEISFEEIHEPPRHTMDFTANAETDEVEIQIAETVYEEPVTNGPGF